MTDKSNEKNAIVRLGGLWKNTSKNGVEYLSGNLGMGKLLIFKNLNKEDGSNAPDYYINIAEKRETRPATNTTSTGDEPPF